MGRDDFRVLESSQRNEATKSARTEEAPGVAGAGGPTRRAFLKLGGLKFGGLVSAGMVAAPLTSASRSAQASEAQGIRQRVTLGKTGIEVPDISFGTFSLGESDLDADERLVRHALDRGITHFDTAEGYTNGRAEIVLGRALKGHRDEVTITTKFIAEASHSAEHQMKVLEESLRRLQTDHVDLYLNHAVNSVDRIASEQWQAFTMRAKEQGKIRATGMSGHAPRLAECMEYALDQGLVDVFLVAYNFAQQPSFKESAKAYLGEWLPGLDIIASQARLPSLIARAHDAGVGVMVMKTLKGARLNDMRPFERAGRTFAQSAFRWVLSDPSVDGLVVSMTSQTQVDEYVEASGSGAPDREDLALLARYLAHNAGSSCTIGCGDCLSACPAGVPTADVMRMRMYDLDYGLHEVARREYTGLTRGPLAVGVDASPCLTCSGAPCAGSCSSGLPIALLNRDTHERLG